MPASRATDSGGCTPHATKWNYGAGRARRDGARLSSLVPRPSSLGPRSLVARSSVPRSLGLSIHAARRWSPRSACARHKTTSAVSDANGGGAQLPQPSRRPCRAAARRRGCAGCVAAASRRDRYRGRVPPPAASRPLRRPARPRGAPSEAYSKSWPRRPHAPLEVGLLQVDSRNRSARLVKDEIPASPQLPRPFPAFTEHPA